MKRGKAPVCRLNLILSGLFLVAGMISAMPAWPGFIEEYLIDPEDGALDASDWLASAKGFLPAPIIITEPAVGLGLGAAVAYFHPPVERDPEVHPHQGPPSISLGFGAYTENDTYLYGGGHSGVWKDGHIRYLGVVARSSINMRFYGLNSGTSQFGARRFDGVKFNIDGVFTLQEAHFRLSESDWWLGVDYIFLDSTAEFDLPGLLPPPVELPGIRFDIRSAGLGAFVEYDGRNTTFTPSSGTFGKLHYANYDEAWGGDFDYDFYEGQLLHWIPFGEYSSLGLRLEGQKVSGDAPFFAFPFVNLRGIPALRYQGEEVPTAEAEYLWGITPRWSLAVFYGAGKAFGHSRQGRQNNTVDAIGAGFRYRLARKFGLQAGVDVAKGPEDTAFYITLGNAW